MSHSYSIIEDVLGDEHPRTSAYRRTSYDRYQDPIPSPRVVRDSQRPGYGENDERDEDTGIVPDSYNAFNDGMQCRDIVNHVENCPICEKHFNMDKKFYIFIIIVLLVLLLALVRKHLR